MAAPEPPQPPPEGSKPLSALLSGIAQAAYYGNADITEDLLRGQLYPEAAPEEFRALHAKMGGLLQSIASADMDLNQLEAFLTAQTKKQGGITSDQAAVIAKFWKNHRMKIHESLINQSRWGNVLKNINWRVDLKSQSRHMDQINTPVAIVEMELGKIGQSAAWLCHLQKQNHRVVRVGKHQMKSSKSTWKKRVFFCGPIWNRSSSVWSLMRPR
ncbi:COMM domain-containing protein 1 isoform X1 [Pezoporus flaviventris]|uniref:COMM domain-containing protein 1 isoform X1 n=1 Tax=Pezoporus flaviventris TaxID=889875 RepID=UPI002AB1825D|nr:COMM domain-containing protein 1 isoform X1 [Pezoporus flaviventris]